jgi:hypothetical protein
LLQLRNDVLRSQYPDPLSFLGYALPLLKQGWKNGLSASPDQSQDQRNQEHDQENPK